MSKEYILEKKEIIISEDASLILEDKVEDYEWTEVTYKSKNKKIFIGSFFTDGYSEKQWMEYNSKYVVIMKDKYGYIDDEIDYYDDDNFGYIGPSVVTMFSIDSESFIEGSDKEKLDLYENEFKLPINPKVRKLVQQQNNKQD